MRIIPYGKHHITEEDIRDVIKVLKSEYITQGPVIQDFEKALCNKLNVPYAVTFNSGTSALHGAYFALDLPVETEFITSPITFVATSNAGLYLGLKPVFCDVELGTGNIDPEKIEELITKKTGFLVPVHYSGHPADLEKIRDLANHYNLKIIEDASHALGATYKNSVIGDCEYSDMAIFSFHPVKHVATGEGGVVMTRNKDYYDRLIQFRTHGLTREKLYHSSPGPWYYEMQYLGYNYRLTDFQAALGKSQLRRLDENIRRRREIAENYNHNFKNDPRIITYPEQDYAKSAYHLYPARMSDPTKRKKTFEKLREHGIYVQVHYIPVYQQPFYQDSGYKNILCKSAEAFYNSEISLPMYPTLSEEDQAFVINTLKKILDES